MEVTSMRGLIVFLILAAGFALVMFEWRRYFRNERLLRERKLHRFTEWTWTQDGFVRHCRDCPVIQYGGDDCTPDINGPLK